ncbi:uncharacterized protein PADG_11800 [Paracoccidioides brasiliensis Pb18]|uniref:Uncharacterized protein n=1 Tax=Paracoccidioides brasiliensis (strain Pb18) TaxID=502780 RepID=A0A0A0HUI3_PARBD|nr:uncharacterized protein PADG_11800 [Paracoccidioides brasiliensis Pb18]KGM92013.1 hypothetical protein PADG_11800 [Paracoccidioides brasiliensis Pb18]
MDLGEFQLRGRLRPTSANWVFACMRVYHEVPDWLSLSSGIPGFDPVYQSHTKVCLETSEESRRSTLHRLLLKSSSYHFCLNSVIISSFVKSSNHSFKEPPTNNQPRTELRRAVSPTDPSVLFSTE